MKQKKPYMAFRLRRDRAVAEIFTAIVLESDKKSDGFEICNIFEGSEFQESPLDMGEILKMFGSTGTHHFVGTKDRCWLLDEVGEVMVKNRLIEMRKLSV